MKRLKSYVINKFRAVSLLLRVLIIFFSILSLYFLILILKQINLFGFLFSMLKVTSPVILGFILAWMLYPVIKWLQDKRINKWIAIFLVYLVIFAIFALLILVLIPMFIKQLQGLSNEIPIVVDTLNKWLKSFLSIFEGFINPYDTKAMINNTVSDWITGLTRRAPEAAYTTLSVGFSIIFGTVVTILISFYILADYKNIVRWFKGLIPNRFKNDTFKLLNSLNTEFYGYVRGIVIIMAILFVISFLTFSMLGLRGAVLLALLVAITEIVPIFGPLFAGIIVVIIAMSDSLTKGVIVLVAMVIIQQIEENVLQPLIMGKVMRLHPVVVIASLLIAGYFFGIIGMIFAIPAAVLIRTLIIFALAKKQEQEIDVN